MPCQRLLRARFVPSARAFDSRPQAALARCESGSFRSVFRWQRRRRAARPAAEIGALARIARQEAAPRSERHRCHARVARGAGSGVQRMLGAADVTLTHVPPVVGARSCRDTEVDAQSERDDAATREQGSGRLMPGPAGRRTVRIIGARALTYTRAARSNGGIDSNCARIVPVVGNGGTDLGWGCRSAPSVGAARCSEPAARASVAPFSGPPTKSSWQLSPAHPLLLPLLLLLPRSSVASVRAIGSTIRSTSTWWRSTSSAS